MVPDDRLCVIVLAAGRSQRLGRDKATLPWGDRTLVRYVIDQFAAGRVLRRLVMANAYNQRSMRLSLPADVEIVVNPNPVADMISSVRLGIAAMEQTPGPLCIHPVDVFAVSADLVGHLHDAWRKDPMKIHLPEVNGRGAHPILMPRRFVPAIRALQLGRGLNELLFMYRADVVRHVWPDEQLLADLDMPDDYARHAPERHVSVQM